ncbi:hypothetical protein Pst134EA_015527 [Puccinia striiformis f. sp. tritici]|uniref:hypothetical protein n=1 Tax=Puccinia striiformis f. sp. tritici TaxID=168172 RepID=UPI0020075118|nr:hypothetical protein Pst134EA_015527 [Puccinia striiformis f. sp. tritici]KAH9463443.1 hypothetical protein Pst134EA_015527 [Puccinia striiformis f. sp. tritici]
MLKYLPLLAYAFTYAPTLLASQGPNPKFLGLPICETRDRSHNDWSNNTHSTTTRDNSPFSDLPSSRNLVYKYDQVTLIPKLEPFRNGFYRSTCFQNLESLADDAQEELCIFINPTINHGQGMVIVTPTKLFELRLDSGIDLSDDPPHHGTVTVVDMPEKGGKGAVASRDLQTGDYIAMTRPVALLPSSDDLWETRLGRRIRRHAIDHLPLRTRAEIATYHGEGETEEEYLSSLVDMNVLGSDFGEGGSTLEFGALVLEPARLNHACRPNVVFYQEESTQMLHMRTSEPVAKGEELTINYRDYEVPRHERRQELQESYGFNCTCSHCQLSEELGELSDRRVAQISELRYQDFSDLTIDQIEEQINLCKMEKIPDCIAESSLVAAHIYNTHGQMDQVRRHAEVARELGILTSGLAWKHLEKAEKLLNLSTP